MWLCVCSARGGRCSSTLLHLLKLPAIAKELIGVYTGHTLGLRSLRSSRRPTCEKGQM